MLMRITPWSWSTSIKEKLIKSVWKIFLTKKPLRVWVKISTIRTCHARMILLGDKSLFSNLMDIKRWTKIRRRFVDDFFYFVEFFCALPRNPARSSTNREANRRQIVDKSSTNRRHAICKKCDLLQYCSMFKIVDKSSTNRRQIVDKSSTN